MIYGYIFVLKSVCGLAFENNWIWGG